MIYTYEYSNNDLEYYDNLNRCTIKEDSVIFQTNDNDNIYEYEINLSNLVEYIRDYYEDSLIENADGLCDYISILADGYDLTAIVRLLDGLDTDNEFFIVDYYDNIIPFNNMDELSEIYDIAEVIEDLINRGNLSDYCEKLSGF